MKRTLQHVVKMVDGVWCGSGEDLARTCDGVVTDSRQVRPGHLFVPLKGERFDGCEFIPEALAKGAVASLYPKDRPVPAEWTANGPLPLIFVDDPLAALQRMADRYRQEWGGRVVAITGSNGKTTTKDVTAAVLAQQFRVHKTAGNLNNHIGLPLTLLAIPQEAEVAVVEMGMNHPGEIAFLSRLARPDVGIITNIGDAHLEHLGSREAIAAAKLEIVHGLNRNGALIVNGDEPLLRTVPYDGAVYRFGFGDGNDLRLLTAERAGRWQTRFTTNRTVHPLTVPLIGRHMLQNVLAAVLCALYFGLSESQIQQGLQAVQLSGMRMEPQKGPNGMQILMDAYNASPTSMRAALELLAELDGFSIKLALLGDMLELGAQEETLHRQVAHQLSPSWLDGLFTYGSRARWISLEAERLGFPVDRIFHTDDPQVMAQALRSWAKPGTVLLVKGSRGMRMEKIIEALRGEGSWTFGQ